MRDEDYLGLIIRPLLDKPDQLQIQRTVDELGVLLRVTSSSDDLGRLLGRGGETAKAVRTIMRVFGRGHAKISVKINA